MYAHVAIKSTGKIVVTTCPEKVIVKRQRRRVKIENDISSSKRFQSRKVSEIDAVKSVCKKLLISSNDGNCNTLSFRTGRVYGVPFTKEKYVDVQTWNYMLPSGSIELAYKIKVHHKLVSW